MTHAMDEDRAGYKIIAVILIAVLAAGVLSYGYSVFFMADEAGDEATEAEAENTP